MAKKEAKKENSKNKRSFFKDFKAELKKVSWPTPKQLVNNTIAVITIVIITAVIVFVLDIVFETLNKQGVEKIKEIVVDNSTSEEGTSNETDNETVDNETTGEEQEQQEPNEEDSNTENNNEEGNTNTENNEQ